MRGREEKSSASPQSGVWAMDRGCRGRWPRLPRWFDSGGTRSTSRVAAMRRIPPKGCANAAALTGTRSGAVASSRRSVVRRAFQGVSPIAIRQPAGVIVDVPKGHEPMGETTSRRPSVLAFRLELRITTANCADRARAAHRAGRRPAQGVGRARQSPSRAGTDLATSRSLDAHGSACIGQLWKSACRKLLNYYAIFSLPPIRCRAPAGTVAVPDPGPLPQVARRGTPLRQQRSLARSRLRPVRYFMADPRQQEAQYRTRHHRCYDRHDDKHRKCSRRDKAQVVADIEHNELHQ